MIITNKIMVSDLIMSVDFNISLPNDKGTHVSTHGTNYIFSSFAISLDNIHYKGHTWLEKVITILWKQTVEANV